MVYIDRMIFPEKLSSDPIVIDDHCAIVLEPQPRGCFLLVACNKSSRRIKICVDLTLSTRYCVFLPVVGTVDVGPMIVEATIAPYRVRNIGLMGPEKGTKPLQHAHLFAQLHYVVHVFVEDEKGVMVPAYKWRKGTREKSKERTPSTFLPTTSTDLWSFCLPHLRVNEFLVRKRNVTAVPPGEGGSKGKNVLVQVDEIAGGAAYLLSAVNKGHTPQCVRYRCPFEGDNSPCVCFVPMDGHKCENTAEIEGYVPVGGDVALGWVLRTGADMPLSTDLFSPHAFTAIVCGSGAEEKMVPQSEKDAKTTNPTFNERDVGSVANGGTFPHSQRRSGSSTDKNNLSQNLLPPCLECFSVDGLSMRGLSEPPANACALTFTRSFSTPAARMVRANFESPGKQVGKNVLTMRHTSLSINMPSGAAQTEERSESSEPAAVQELEESGEERMISFEESSRVGYESNSFTEHGNEMCDLEEQHMRDLRDGTPEICSENETRFEAEVKHRTALLGATQSVLPSFVEPEEDVMPVCGEMVNEDKEEKEEEEEEEEEEEKASTVTASVKHTWQKIDGEEAIKRISIETAETIEWKVFLQQWRKPLCLICRQPIPPGALVVEEPSSGNTVHFVCYTEVRQQLATAGATTGVF
ncbi:hypothetical protein MOQ_004196 [Trypanosoma cruzi marinkellei]|uniref:Uncharacterized protein n=1 Tax=Trypanosoma cruzi marinkellei TaxID=85056 RepID=K2NAQ9_TRYCR|nr:hypothetical protein MOQ_004196 [Trypanosoma cruzi marinkellei]